MSIKGIDAQIMITRAAQLAKENSTIVRKDELTQEYLAAQQKAAGERDQKAVLRSAEAEGAPVHLEKDGKSGHGRDRKQNEKRDWEESAGDPAGTLVPSVEQKIDITI